MLDVLGDTYKAPLVPVEQWAVIDSTKVNTFVTCNRLYFYQYVLGWRPDRPNLHLHFGTAWHRAMEHMLRGKGEGGYSPELVVEAYDLFLSTYREAFDETLDAKHAPKDPSTALKALVEYAARYSEEDSEFDVLYTEIAGSVPVDERRVMTFKMDTAIRGQMGIASLEHKTTGRNSQEWMEDFKLSIQVGTYSLALQLAFPDEDVYGVLINGVVLKKSGVEFLRPPISMDVPRMGVWLWNLLYQLNMIEYHFHELSKASPDDHILKCFPLNPGACTKYGLCPYHAYCTAWPNPLERAEEPPPGMAIDHWDPRRQIEEAKVVLSKDGSLTEQVPVERETPRTTITDPNNLYTFGDF